MMRQNPEAFLDYTFRSLQPTENLKAQVGKVLVYPSDTAIPDARESDKLRSQLVHCLESLPSLPQIPSPQGEEVDVFKLRKYPVLRWYVIRIVLHADSADPWIQVAPEG
ncbi:MAG TPA: hypothetical protein VG675_01745 [Bryobacteraceae bacterium]|nr:hypothetical protein [Bryobacteraceae bacterium]